MPKVTATKVGHDFDHWRTENGSNTYDNEGTGHFGESITLYAVWEAKDYTATVNPNGGTWDGKTTSSTVTQKYGTTKVLGQATATGKLTVTFDNNGGQNTTTSLDSNKVFDKWELEGAGSITGANNTYTFGAGTSTIKATYKQAEITLPTVTKNGYGFAGWYNSEDKKVGVAGDKYTPTEDETLTAKWSADTHTVTYNYSENGGTSTTKETEIVAFDSPVDLTPTAVKSGYVFVGWNTDKTATTKLNSLTMAGSDITLYAIFSKTVDLTFKDAQGTRTQSVTFYNKEKGTTTSPAIRAYENGWNKTYWTTSTAANGSKTVDENTAINNIDAPKTYYARYTKDITISFNLNGGSGTTPADIPGTVQVNSSNLNNKLEPTIGMPEVSTAKEGYTFGGWKTLDGSHTYEDEGNGTFGDSLTLYAIWEENTYNISFNKNGGSGTMANITGVRYTEEKQLTSNAYTRTGYTFKGWATSENGEKVYDNGAKVSKLTATNGATVTLYAVWKDETAPEVTITRTNYNTFNWTAVDEVGVTGYKITTTATKPSASDSGWTTTGTVTNGSREVSEEATYYVWAKDEAGNVNNAVSISAYTMTRNQGTGTGLVTRVDATNGTTGKVITEETTIVLNNTSVWVSASVNTGYKNLTLKKGNTSLNVAGQTVAITENTTFASSAELNQFKVTFNPNGGTVNPTSKDVVYGKPYGELPTPTKDGYGFDGWYTDATNGDKIEESTIVALTANQTLYAHWTAGGYSISYNLDGGSVTGNPTSYTIESEAITLNNPTKPGHNFAGWTGTGLNSATMTVTIPHGSTGNRSYTATWTKCNYSVTFNPNGGTVNPTSKDVVYSEPYGELPTPTRNGYDFLGWFTDAEAGDEINSTTTVQITENQTLYAHWNIITYTITYNGMSGWSVTPLNPTTYTIESESITLNNPTRTGYTFTGWTGTGLNRATMTVTIPHESTGNRTYTLNSRANTYTVSFNANGGVAEYTSKTVVYKAAYGSLPNAESEGKEFLGWYTEQTGGTKVEPATIVNTASNHTLYAHYEDIYYTATFDPNEGTITTGSNTMQRKYGQTLGTLPEATRDGYDFVGWFDDGRRIYSTDTMPAMDTTYIAEWEEQIPESAQTATATFNPNGGMVIGDSTITKEVGTPIGNLPTAQKNDFVFDDWWETRLYITEEEQQITIHTGIPNVQYTVTSDLGLWFTGTANANGESTEFNNPYNEQFCTDYFIVKLNGDETEYKFVKDETEDRFVFEGHMTTESTLMPEEDVTYYAHWKIDTTEYSAYFNPNAEGAKLVTGSTPISRRPGKVLGTLPTTALKGYQFGGWNTEVDGSGTQITAQTLMPARDINYYAQYTPNTYTIVYNGNGSTSGSTASTNGIYDQSVALRRNGYIKSGYEFVSWNTEANGTGTTYTNGQIVMNLTATNNGQVTLYAQWKEIGKNTATFDPQGGTINGPSTISKIEGEQLGTLPTATLKGYDLIGWFTEETNGTQISETTPMPSTDVTYYAHWQIRENTATFDPTGGTISSGSNTITKQYDQELGTLPEATRTGHTFEGWYESKDMPIGLNNGQIVINTGVQSTAYEIKVMSDEGAVLSTITETTDEDGVITLNTNQTNGNTFTLTITGDNTTYIFEQNSGGAYVQRNNEVTSTTKMPEEDVTYYAKWIVGEYVVTFNANGGTTPNPETIKGTYGQPIGTLPTSERTGYTLGGWYTAATGGTKITENTQIPSENVTYYAHWTANEYEITLDAGDVSELDFSFSDDVEDASLEGGGSGSSSSSDINYGTTKVYETYGVKYSLTSGGETTTTITKPEKTGYTFGGYYTEEDGNGDQIINENGQIIAPNTKFTENSTIYAKWTVNSYKATFDPNTGTITNAEPGTLIDGKSELTLNYKETFGGLPRAEKTGYTFNGWYTSETGGSKITESTTMDAKDVTYYAHWTPNEYEITLDAGDVSELDFSFSDDVEDASLEGGGSGSSSSSDINYGTTKVYETYGVKYSLTSGGEATTTITKPEKTGYTFGGYYTEENGNGDQIINGNGEIIAENTKFTSNATIYAKWTVNEYEITLDSGISPENETHLVEIGDYVDYDVEYNDAATTSTVTYTKDTAWRVMNKTENPDGSYNLDLISTGIPAILNYVSEITSIENDGETPGNWAGNSEQREQFLREYNFSGLSVNTPNIYTASGLLYNFENIIFRSGSNLTRNTGGLFYNNNNKNYAGYKRIINNAPTVDLTSPVVGERLFKAYTKSGQVTGIRSVNLKDIKGINDRSDVSDITEENDKAQGLFKLDSYSSVSRGGVDYILATPTKITSGIANRDYYMSVVKNDGRIVSTFGNVMGLRPVVSIENVGLSFDKTSLIGETEVNHWNISETIQKVIEKQNAGTRKIYETYGEKFSLTSDGKSISNIKKPQKTGYTFGGYYTEQNGAGDQIINPEGKIVVDNTRFTSNATIYAKWTINDYKLTYDYNFNGEARKNEFIDTGYKINWDKDFTFETTFNFQADEKRHLITGNWIDIEDDDMTRFGIEVFKDNNHVNAFRVYLCQGKWENRYDNASYQATPNEDIKVVFNWNASTDSFKVTAKGDTTDITIEDTYQMSGISRYTQTIGTKDHRTEAFAFEEINLYEPKITTTQTYGTPLENFYDNLSRTGYTFEGWYTDPVGGTEITGTETMPGEDTTYYAHWSINEYNITYDNNYLNRELYGADTVNTANWKSWSTTIKAINAYDLATAKNGKGIKIRMNAGTEGGAYYKYVALTPGKTYTWSVVLQTNEGNASGTVGNGKTMNLRIGHEQGGTTTIITSPYSEKYTYTFTATENTKQGFIIYPGSGETWSDNDIIFIHSLEIAEESATGNLSINGATWDNDHLVFDGTDDWASLGKQNFDKDVTVEAEVSFDTVKTNEETAIVMNLDGGGYGLLLSSGGYPRFEAYIEGKGWRIATAPNIAEAGRRYKLSGTYDGSAVKLYIDGELVATQDVDAVGTIKEPLNDSVMTLGVNPQGENPQANYLDGNIYQARIYNRTLTAEEIAQNWTGEIVQDHLIKNITPETKNVNKVTRKMTYGGTLEDIFKPERTGYIFTGWYTDPYGGKQISKVTAIPGENTTYYAHWEKEGVPVPTWQAHYEDGTSYTSGTWTNRDVYTLITVNSPSVVIKEIQYSFDKSEWTKLDFNHSGGLSNNGGIYSGDEYWVKRNGRNQTVYFRAKSTSGEFSPISEPFTIRYDIEAPSVTITANATSLINVTNITYTFQWSENVTDFTVDDINVANGTKGTFTKISDNKYTLVVAKGSAQWQEVSVPENICIDRAGNQNTAKSIRISSNPVISVSPANGAAAKTRNITISISDPNGKGLNSNNSYQYYLSDSSTALSGGSWKSYTKGTAFTEGSGLTGTYYLFVKRVSDSVNNISTSGGTAVTISNVTYQRFGPYVFDNKAPGVTITANKASPTNASSITYTFTFTENVKDFVATDIDVSSGSSKGTFTKVSDSKYTLVVSNSGSGTETVSVAAGKCTDMVGNNNTSGTISITIDRTAPGVTITANESTYTNASSITYTFKFTENVSGFTKDDVTITNGTAGTFSGSGATYTLVVSNSGSCTQKVSVAAGKCTDNLGNGNTKSNTLSIGIDRTKPTIDSLSTPASGVATQLVLKASDKGGSGLKQFAYSTTNSTTGLTWANNTDGSKNITGLKANTKYYFWVKDGAGNISSSESITTLAGNWGIGSTLYDTIQHAAAKVKKGETIKLLVNNLNDASTGDAVIDVNCTINLDNKKVTLGNGGIKLNSNTLTVEGGSKGHMTRTLKDSRLFNVYGGTLNIESGEYSHTGTGQIGIILSRKGTPKVNIKGGKLYTKAKAREANVIEDWTEGVKTTISGGTLWIEGTYSDAKEKGTSQVVDVGKNCSLSVTGGTIESKVSGLCNAIIADVNSSVTINGKNVKILNKSDNTRERATVYFKMAAAGTGSFTFKAGTIKNSASNGYAYCKHGDKNKKPPIADDLHLSPWTK